MVGKNVKISAGAIIKGPTIIEDNCRIGNSVIGPYSHVMHDSIIGDHSTIAESIVFEHCSIGNHCLLQESIVDGYSVMQDYARVERHGLLGFKTRVGRHARIFAGSRIWPGIEVNHEAVVEGDIFANVAWLKKEMQESRFWK